MMKGFLICLVTGDIRWPVRLLKGGRGSRRDPTVPKTHRDAIAKKVLGMTLWEAYAALGLRCPPCPTGQRPVDRLAEVTDVVVIEFENGRPKGDL